MEDLLEDLYELHSFAFKDYGGKNLKEMTEFM